MTIVRQGDVLLRRVRSLPASATSASLSTLPGRIVLAYGEVTGHHHSVAAQDAELLKTAEAVYLRVMTATPLEHQEHAAIQLDPGIWQVTIQREYSPADIRTVAD